MAAFRIQNWVDISSAGCCSLFFPACFFSLSCCGIVSTVSATDFNQPPLPTLPSPSIIPCPCPPSLPPPPLCSPAFSQMVNLNGLLVKSASPQMVFICKQARWTPHSSFFLLFFFHSSPTALPLTPHPLRSSQQLSRRRLTGS